MCTRFQFIYKVRNTFVLTTLQKEMYNIIKYNYILIKITHRNAEGITKTGEREYEKF